MQSFPMVDRRKPYSRPGQRVTETHTEAAACRSLTLEPVSEVVQPHLGKLLVVLQHDILHTAETLVKVVKQVLDVGVVCLLGDDVHVVEREVLELCSYEVVFPGFPGDDVREVQPVSHSGGPIKADP